MAITVDWSSTPFLITCPQSDLTFVSGTKYQITVEYLWQLLRNFSDKEEAITQPIIFTNTPPTASTPRIIEVNDSYYQWQFEDGVYSVEIIGGNSNIRDVEVKNTVSVGTNNTTGFIDPVFLEASLFNGNVYIDAINGVAGTSKTPAGGIIGTVQTPSNNLNDALIIAQTRGIFEFLIRGDLTISEGDFTAGYVFKGTSPISSAITIESLASVNNCEFWNTYIEGEVDNNNVVKECLIGNVTSFDGFLDRCGLNSVLSLGGFGQTTLIDCFSNIAGELTPEINIGIGSALAIRGYKGGVEFTNKTGEDKVSADMDSGQVKVADTCIAGIIILRGSGDLIDHSPVDGTEVIDKMLHDGKVNNIKQLIELQYPSHSASGTVFYWDPYSGDDLYEGDHIKRGKKTFSACHDLVMSGRNDLIVCISNDPSGNTFVDENISITKNDLCVRGTGRGFHLEPSSTVLPAFEILANNIELNSISIKTPTTCQEHMIDISANNTLIRDIWLFEGGKGMHIGGTSSDTMIKNTRIAHNIGDGLLIDGSAEHTSISQSHISSNTGNGITMNTIGHEISVNDQTVLHGNGGWGIDILPGSNGIHILEGVTIYGNTLGDINDNGVDTFNGITDRASKVWKIETRDTKYLERIVWIDTERVDLGDGSQSLPFNNLTAAVDFAEAEGIQVLNVYSDITLDRQLKNFKIIGIGNPTVDTNGQNISKSEFWHCKMEGTYLGTITVQESVLLNGFELNGFFEKNALAGNLVCVDGSTVFMLGNSSTIAGLGRPSISMNGIGSSALSVRDNNGGLTITDCNNALDVVTCEVNVGSLTFDSSCTDGEMVARGTCKFVDNTNGATVTNETINEVTIAAFIWNSLLTSHQIIGSFGYHVSKKLLSVSKFIGLK